MVISKHSRVNCLVTGCAVECFKIINILGVPSRGLSVKQLSLNKWVVDERFDSLGPHQDYGLVV